MQIVSITPSLVLSNSVYHSSMAVQTNTLQMMAPIVDIADDEEVQDEEKAFLLREERPQSDSKQRGLSYKFWLSAAINTVSTIAIVSAQVQELKNDADE